MRTSDHVLSMRIQEGAAGYGIYMMLLELLRDADGRSLVYNPAHLAFAINEQDVDLVKRVCTQYGLFDQTENGRLSSPWLDAQMADYDAKKQAAVEAGRRGAAKRYGKNQAADAENSHPIATLKGGALPPDGNLINSNITRQINLTNPTSKSRLLDMQIGKWSGEELFLIARQKGTPMSPIDHEEAAIRHAEAMLKVPQTHNPEFVYDLATQQHLTHEQYEVVLQLLDGGRVDTPRIREAIRIYNAWRDNQFRAKYPFDYLVCQLYDL